VAAVALVALGKMEVLTTAMVGLLKHRQSQGRLFTTLVVAVLVVVEVQQALEAEQQQQLTRVAAEMDRPPALAHRRFQIPEAEAVVALMRITAATVVPA
jgi:hypothetical protein